MFKLIKFICILLVPLVGLVQAEEINNDELIFVHTVSNFNDKMYTKNNHNSKLKCMTKYVYKK